MSHKLNIIRELKLYYEEQAKLNGSTNNFLVAYNYSVRAKECEIILYKIEVHEKMIKDKENEKK